MDKLKEILALFQLLPALIATIKAIEELAPLPGKGKDKLAMLRELLGLTGASVDALMPLIEKATDIVVKFANAVGAFKKPAA